MLGKVYLWGSLTLFLLGAIWAVVSLLGNTGFTEIVLVVPQIDRLEPFERRRYEVSLGGILVGWAFASALVAVWAIRGPFRIRAAAVAQRRIRDLEREVLELRTLPLRQHEEDEILAAEAHLEPRAGLVMTEKIRLDSRVGVEPKPEPGKERTIR